MARKRGLLFPALGIFSIAAFFAWSRRDFFLLPVEVQRALANPEAVEVLYIDPTAENSKPPAIGGRRVIRRFKIAKGHEGEAIEWLRSLLPHSGLAAPAGCFFPRYALRVQSAGVRYDLLISVECGETLIYRQDRLIAKLDTRIGDGPQRTIPSLPPYPKGAK